MALTPQNILRFLAGGLIAAGILFLIWYFMSVVIYILVSAVLAIMGRPLVNWLAKQHIGKYTLPRWAAASITLIAIIALFSTFFSLFIPLIFGKINEFAQLDFSSVMASVEEPISHAQQYLSRTFALPETHFSLSDTIVEHLGNLVNYNTVNDTVSSVINITLSSLIAIFSISFITFFTF